MWLDFLISSLILFPISSRDIVSFRSNVLRASFISFIRYILNSPLSKIHIDLSIAVTGSLNQFGQVQPIGGVNEKIEGFFNVCKKIGTYIGKAVLIPEIYNR